MNEWIKKPVTLSLNDESVIGYCSVTDAVIIKTSDKLTWKNTSPLFSSITSTDSSQVDKETLAMLPRSKFALIPCSTSLN